PGVVRTRHHDAVKRRVLHCPGHPSTQSLNANHFSHGKDADRRPVERVRLRWKRLHPEAFQHGRTHRAHSEPTSTDGSAAEPGKEGSHNRPVPVQPGTRRIDTE